MLCLALIWDAILRMLDAMETRGAWGVALCLAAAPILWGQMEVHGMDFVSAALTAKCLSHLMASRGLTVVGQARRAGLWLGIGFWVKYTFPVFLLAPCLGILGYLLWDRLRGREDMAQRLRSGIQLTGFFILSAGPLFIFQGRAIINYIHHSISPSKEEVLLMGSLGSASDFATSDLDKALFYAAVLKDLWGWPGLALLGAGLLALVVGWVSRRRAQGPDPDHALRASVLGLLCVLGGTLLLSLFMMKASRYMLPMFIPMIAVLIPPISRRLLTAPLVPAAMAPLLLFVVTDYAGITDWQNFDSGAETVSFARDSRRVVSQFRPFDHFASKTFSHWGRYPLPEEAFRPVSQNPQMFNLTALSRALAEVVPSEGGKVAIYAPEHRQGPTFGMLLMSTEQLGHHWDFITIKILPQQGAPVGYKPFYFQGPFFHDQPNTFHAVMIAGDLSDPLARRFFKGQRLKETFALGSGQNRIRVLCPSDRTE